MAYINPKRKWVTKEGEKLLPTARVPHLLKKCGLRSEGGGAPMTSSSGPGSKFGLSQM